MPPKKKDQYPDPKSFPVPEDFVPDDDFEDEHSKEQTGGPGGVANYNLHPDGI